MKSQKWYGWCPDIPDFEDYKATHLDLVAVPAMNYVPYNYLPPIRDQGEQGSCTGHCAYAHGSVIRAMEQQSYFELSPRFAYWGARRLESTTRDDSGAEIRDVIKACNKWGFSTEKKCPYNPKVWSIGPSTPAFLTALLDIAVDYRRVTRSLQSMKAATLNGGFVFGFSVYENFEGDQIAKDGILTMPSGGQTGGHAVYACGYDDARKAFLIMNSWDDDWGCPHPLGPQNKKGFFWMPYDYIVHPDLADDYWIISKIT